LGSDSISFDCPGDLAIGEDRLRENIMAIYWSKFTTGTVHAMAYDAELYDENIGESIHRKFIGDIEDGLREAFSQAAMDFYATREVSVTRRTIGKIRRAYAFTWNDMINGQPGQQVNSLF